MGKRAFSVGETKGMRECKNACVCVCVCRNEIPRANSLGQGFTDTLVTFHNYVE